MALGLHFARCGVCFILREGSREVRDFLNL
jgi:hypothetical protein